MGKSIPKEIKQKALELFKQSYGYSSTSTLLGVNEGTVKSWHRLFRAGNNTWAESSYVKSDPEVLQKATSEYISSNIGLIACATKYGIRPSKLLVATRNFVNFGLVLLPRGRYAMKKLQNQKQELEETLAKALEKGSCELNKKELKELKELLVVNIALLEVLEESHPEELKKKEFRQQRKRLVGKLAYVERVYCSK